MVVTYTNTDTNAKISKYYISKLKKIAVLVYTFEKFVALNKVVTLKKILSKIQKSLVYNDKYKHFVLTKSLTIQ